MGSPPPPPDVYYYRDPNGSWHLHLSAGKAGDMWDAISDKVINEKFIDYSRPWLEIAGEKVDW